jgi:hypothetical protein
VFKALEELLVTAQLEPGSIWSHHAQSRASEKHVTARSALQSQPSAPAGQTTKIPQFLINSLARRHFAMALVGRLSSSIV